jgi:hypothetical protein
METTKEMKMSQMMKIEMDVSWDETSETLADVLAELERECGAKFEVVSQSGPGGGWPVVEFLVNENNLDDLLARLGLDDSDIEYHKGHAEPA